MTIFSPTIIDIEASGFGIKSYPIEIGVVNHKGQRFCRLVKPLPHWTHWDEQAESLHGISRQDLHNYGIEPMQVCIELNAFLQSTTAYSDGWVVDSTWINRLFGEVGIAKQFHLSSLELILSEAQMNMWHQVKDNLLTEHNVRRHRASADANIVQQTYNKTQEIIASMTAPAILEAC